MLDQFCDKVGKKSSITSYPFLTELVHGNGYTVSGRAGRWEGFGMKLRMRERLKKEEKSTCTCSTFKLEFCLILKL